MNPINPTQSQNPGSFMAPAGGQGDVLQDAMRMRGYTGGGPTNQSTQGGVLPSESPPMPSPTPLPSAMQQQQPAIQPQAPMQNPNVPAPHGQNPEVMHILKAMDQYMRSAAKVNEALHGVQK